MIGVDTNVLVRLVAVDSQKQHRAALAFFAERSADDPAFVSAIVLAETIWLLRKRLGYSKDDIEDVVTGLLSSDDFIVEGNDRIQALLDTGQAQGAELADHLIAWACERAGSTRTVTFDRRAALRIPSMELLS